MGFIKTALLALVLGGISSGLVSPFVFMRRIGFITGGLSHALLGVVGVALLLGLSPTLVAIPSAVVLAVFMQWLQRRTGKGQSDVAIALVWTLGMAVGIVAMSRVKGYVPDVMSYLFGNVLLLKQGDLIVSGLISAVVSVVLLVGYRWFLAVCVDEEFSLAQGIRVEWVSYLLLSLIALVVVALMKSLGIVLMIAFLIVPPAISCRRAKGIPQMMLFSVSISLTTSLLGFAVAYFWDIPVSAGVVFALAGMYLLM